MIIVIKKGIRGVTLKKSQRICLSKFETNLTEDQLTKDADGTPCQVKEWHSPRITAALLSLQQSAQHSVRAIIPILGCV